MKQQRTMIRIKIVFHRLMSATCFINIKSVYIKQCLKSALFSGENSKADQPSL